MQAPVPVEAVMEWLERDGIEQLWISYHDYHGRAGAKSVPKSGFESALREGIVFAKANLNFDLLDHQPAGAELLADSGDFFAVPDPRSYAVLPGTPRTARMHAWMRSPDGEPWDGCPRTRLDTMVGRLAERGYSAQVALEPEFYILRESESGEFLPTNQSGMFTRDGLAAERDLIDAIYRHLESMGVTVAQVGKEYGPGQYEISTRHGAPVEAVDNYYTLKDAVRDTARDHGYVASFMPKPYAAWAGCGLHVHLSLWDAEGNEHLTAAPDNDTELSQTGLWFLGGLLRHAGALTALGAPTVNSYKRLLPGSWAPANTYWGYGNRSAIVRVPGSGPRRRLEFRSADNACQPFIFLSALLAAGLNGIEEQIDPGPPFQGDIGHLSPVEIDELRLGFLPRSLPEAFAALKADSVIREGAGEDIIRGLLIVKEHELAQYDIEVHPWERAAYLRSI